MKRPLSLALAAALSLSLLAACAPKEPPAASNGPSASQSSSADVSPDEAEPQLSDPSGELKLKKFKNIRISVLSPNIRVERGEDWSVRYTLHKKEQITRAQVVDDTFYFSSGFKLSPGMELKDYELVVTIPADAQLEDVELSTAAGTVTLADLTLEELDVESVSGDVNLENLVSQSIDAESVSGNVTLLNCTAKEAEGDSTSGSVRLEGTFDDVEMSSVSGSCQLYAEIHQEAQIKTVSGPVKAQSPVSLLEIQTLGVIRVDGEKQKGKSFSRGEGSPVLHIESVSGDVEADQNALVMIQ